MCRLRLVILGGWLWLLAMPFAVAENWRLLTTTTMSPFYPLVQQLLAQADIHIEVRIVPQARMIDELKQGLADGAFFLTPKAMKAVPGLQPVPVVLHHYELVAVTRDATEQFSDLRQLATYRVGLERGSQVAEQLAANAALPKLYRASSVPVLAEAFAADRFDILLLGREQVVRQLKRAGVDHYLIHEPPIAREPLYLMLTAKRASSIPMLTQVFEQVIRHTDWMAQKEAVLQHYLR